MQAWVTVKVAALRQLHLLWLALPQCCQDSQSPGLRTPKDCDIRPGGLYYILARCNADYAVLTLCCVLRVCLRDHYLFKDVEAYSSALPPQEASVPKIPSDGARLCPAILAGQCLQRIVKRTCSNSVR